MSGIFDGEQERTDDLPLVSVLVPVYNAERHLERCLDSVLGQSYPAIQVVAIDDGSQDGSPQMLDDYAALHPGVFLVEHRANGGVASARNRAIELAQGEYLCFLDNDDWLDEGCVEALVTAAQERDAQVVCAGYRRPGPDGRVRVEVSLDPSGDWSPFLVVAGWAKLFRRDYVIAARLAYLDTNIGEDICFTLPAVLDALHVEVIPYVGYNWFLNEESVSSTSHKTSDGLDFERMLDTLHDDLVQRGIAIEGLVAHYFVRLVVWFLTYTRHGDGARLSRHNLARYAGWLDDHVPNWRHDPYAAPSLPTGDAPANRLATWLFVHHPHLFALALTVYRA